MWERSCDESKMDEEFVCLEPKILVPMKCFQHSDACGSDQCDCGGSRSQVRNSASSGSPMVVEIGSNQRITSGSEWRHLRVAMAIDRESNPGPPALAAEPLSAAPPPPDDRSPLPHGLLCYRQTPGYGSLPATATGEGLAPAKRVIYCVHGNLMGCCMVGGDSGDLLAGGGDKASSGPGGNGVPHALKEPPTVISGDHCHRSRDEIIDQKARRKLIIASVLCVVFMIGEIIGGVLSSSLAIATDAAHLLTDFASFMISLFSLWVASRPPTRRMSFGWYRAEVIGALTSVLMIWVVTGVLVYLAVERIVKKDFEIDAKVMLITSAIGVLVNLVMGLTLHQHGHVHSSSHSDSHGHSHGSADSHVAVEAAHPHIMQPNQNINVRAAFIHVVGDFLQSFGVLVAALVIYFKPSWSIVDPICTFLFSILVIFTTFAIIKDTLVVLMEGIPKGIDFAAVMETFLQIDGVIKVHNLRIWALSLDKTALAAHLAIRPGVSPQEVLTSASRNIHDRFNFFEMTLQIEEFDQNMEHCTQCKNPPES